MVTQGLIFPFAEVARECELLKSYAKDFLDATTIMMIDEAKAALTGIQQQGDTKKTTPWRIPIERPLRTAWSNGEYQPSAKGAHCVRASLAFVWDIRPLDEGKWRGRKHFVLDGIASTLIDVVETTADGERCLARWRVEVGDHQSPGTHFHVQLNTLDGPQYPSSFDVPRLPSMLMSPLMVVETVLAELFQDRWKKHAVQDTAEGRAWKNIHQPRLAKYLQWQAGRLGEQWLGSPWIALKLARPSPDLLVAK